MQPNCKPAYAVQFSYWYHRISRHVSHRISLRSLGLLLSVLSLFISPVAASAQGPTSFWIPPIDLNNPSIVGESSADAPAFTPPFPLIVDTDPGVDDAVALTWLLSQTGAHNILGLVSVAGNTTVENATNNIFTVLNQLGNPNIRVVEGAQEPLDEKLSATGKLIHGKDGLWGLQEPQVATSSRRDARRFYSATARQRPGTSILALGPLTNIASAIRYCPEAMRSYSRIVILGSAKFGGNATPVAEFNFWQDPEAAQIVLRSGMNIEIIPQDAFTQLAFSFPEILGIGQSSLPALRYLAPALTIFAGSQLAAGVPAASIPDLAAAIYTLTGLGTPVSALVEVVDEPDSVRGQSIIGLSRTERITMIADDEEMDKIANQSFDVPGPEVPDDPNLPNFIYINERLDEILAQVEDNAQVVVDIDEAAMRALFLDFTITVSAIPDANPEEIYQPENQIFLPSIAGE